MSSRHLLLDAAAVLGGAVRLTLRAVEVHKTRCPSSILTNTPPNRTPSTTAHSPGPLPDSIEENRPSTPSTSAPAVTVAAREWERPEPVDLGPPFPPPLTSSASSRKVQDDKERVEPLNTGVTDGDQVDVKPVAKTAPAAVEAATTMDPAAPHPSSSDPPLESLPPLAERIATTLTPKASASHNSPFDTPSTQISSPPPPPPPSAEPNIIPPPPTIAPEPIPPIPEDLPNPTTETPTPFVEKDPPLVTGVTETAQDLEPPPAPAPIRTMKSSTVPSSRLGRLFHYGGLAAGLSYGAAGEYLRRATGGQDTGSVMLSEANARRLVDKLGRMRGAALKLGQFMSIQDAKVLPAQVEQILMEVQNSANYMPESQTEKVLTDNLGPSWRDHFSSFDMIPFAAASLGQVHRAVLSPSSPLSKRYGPSLPLAVKIQFPGVKSSITSDLSNLKWLLVASSVLPRGLYLENTLKVMEAELEDECDYEREAQCGIKMRELVKGGKDGFEAPVVVEELCGPMVLTAQMMEGVALSKTIGLSQETRDEIGERVLSLCMRELFHYRFMQTDPNWGNFLYNSKTRRIEIIDFGATRGYSQEFIDKFHGLIMSAVHGDVEEGKKFSSALGYFTGGESEEMLNAHLSSLAALGTPFRSNSPQPFDFATLGPPITAAIRKQIPIMLKHRLTPPPPETLSLNRKLSGAFLLCERLGSRVRARKILDEVVEEMKEWRDTPLELPTLRKLEDAEKEVAVK